MPITATTLPIWWLTIHLSEEVHAGPLGFTTTIYEFAFGSSASDAEARASAYLRTKHGLGVTRFYRTRLATNQDPSSYVFPESIIHHPPSCE